MATDKQEKQLSLSPASENTAAKKRSPNEERRRRAGRRAALRACVQIFFFLAMPGAFAAGWNGARAVFSAVGEGAVIGFGSFVQALLLLCGFTLLFGRWFCGYACAFGALGDLVYRLSALVQTKLFRRKQPSRCPEKLARILRYVKYVVLAGLLAACFCGMYGKTAGWSPWDVFSRLASLRFDLAGYAAGGIVLALLIAGMAWQERFFCRFLCPMGALFSCLPVLPFGMLRRNAPECLRGCDLCRKNCPAGIRLEDDGIMNGECLGCERCTGVCPKGNIARAETRLLGWEIVWTLLRAVLFFVLGALCGLCRTF